VNGRQPSQAWRLRGRFGLDSLALEEERVPAPGRGEVAVRLRAVSLNYRDLMMARGEYDPRQSLPLIPCSDGVGEVVATGDGVRRVAVGDRVCPIFAQRWIAGEPTREKLRSTLGGPLQGTLRQAMVLSEEGVVPVPEYLSDVEAATLPCAALTAWSALTVAGSCRPGDTVLVLGTGGVALFALQIATLAGARVIVTSSRDEKLERARALGAWEGIHYLREPEWGRRARELTAGRGVDQVVEVGGAGTLAQSLRAVRFGGTVSLIGVLTGGETSLPLASIFMRQVRLQGILVGHREAFEGLLRACEAHRLRPVVDRVFPFAEAPRAFEHLASGAHFGKVVVEI
jgi:NADPH:quinone reductase-like Zn-dependent oxidoreductase